MPRKLELSWVGSLKQWRKRRKVGDKTKTWYLGTGNGKGDMEAYGRALVKWKAIEAELAGIQLQTHYTEYAEKLKAAFAHLPVAIPTIDSGVDNPNLEAKQVRNQGHNGRDKAKPITPTKMLPELLTVFLAVQKRRYEHGLKFPDAPQSDRMGPARYVAYKNIAKHMERVWAATPLPNSEAETFGAMKAYRDFAQDRLNAGTYTASTFNEHVKSMGVFFRWLYENYHLAALPRNMETLTSRYTVKSTAKALDLEVIRQIWGEANDRMKCWIALALNCGLYSSEISHLTAAMLEGGYLFWTRHKTGVPVRFKLWKVTKTLLEKTANKSGYLYTDEDGEQVVQMNVETGSRESKIDNQLTIIKRALKITGVGFSNLRDTSSTKMESIAPTLTDYFDSHADQRMARWYIDHNRLDYDERFDAFDAAVDKLGKWYGLKLAS